MKHKQQIPARKIADATAPNDQTQSQPKPHTGVDLIIDEIQMRANYVGPVLEGILHSGHGREQAGWHA